MPLQIVRQDITAMKVDAIVNTTNEDMIGWSGVDLAIHTAAGPELDLECSKIAPLGLGTAKITSAYHLNAKYLIHTSGPVWMGGLAGESIILRSCYLESLKLAVENKCETIAFPLISSGTYGFPKDKVLKFAIETINDFLFDNEIMVYLCVFDRTSYEFSKKLYTEIKEYIDDNYADNYEDGYITGNYTNFVNTDFSETQKPEEENTYYAAKVHPIGSAANKTLEEYLKQIDKSFAEKLFDLIDMSGMSDVECYKRANIDRKTFSKIKCNMKTYKPSKQTAVAFAVALRLNLDETQELLASAGMTLSRGFVFDKIIRYYIQKGIYDIFEINQTLFEFDQQLLGTC